MLPSTTNFDTTALFQAVNTGNIVAIGLKIIAVIFILLYVFFAFFLYLRIRILALTLVTPNRTSIRFIALLHFFAVLGLALFMGLLLLF